MPSRSTLVQYRQLLRSQRHLLWLQQNLPNSSAVRRTQREILVQRSSLCADLGCTADRIGRQLQQRSSQ